MESELILVLIEQDLLLECCCTTPPKTARRHSEVCRDLEFQDALFSYLDQNNPITMDRRGNTFHIFPPSVGMNFKVFNFWPRNVGFQPQHETNARRATCCTWTCFFSLFSFSFGHWRKKAGVNSLSVSRRILNLLDHRTGKKNRTIHEGTCMMCHGYTPGISLSLEHHNAFSQIPHCYNNLYHIQRWEVDYFLHPENHVIANMAVFYWVTGRFLGQWALFAPWYFTPNTAKKPKSLRKKWNMTLLVIHIFHASRFSSSASSSSSSSSHWPHTIYIPVNWHHAIEPPPWMKTYVILEIQLDFQVAMLTGWYCWWKISCTTWEV